MRIRDADPEMDAPACAAIYAPYVEDSVATFEVDAPGADEIADRMRLAHIWLVAELDGRIAGYAYTTRHRQRAAYSWAADVAVYVRHDRHRGGLGRALYEALIDRARGLGLRTLCGGVAQPNPASNGLHEALGFRRVGTYHRIGWKAGAWHDVVWYQLELRPGDDSPPD